MIYRDQVVLDSGRRLAFEVSGAHDGYPILLLHGTPGSKAGPKPRPIVLEDMGVCLITYDRPGYGGSSRWQGRCVADAAEDAQIIADKLDIRRFGVVGRSGGGPHALAVAAQLPHMVSKTAVLVGIAPIGASDLDWYEGMTDGNVEEYMAADSDLDELEARLTERALLVRDDPDSMVKFLEPQMSEQDKRVVGDIAIRRLLHRNYEEALESGAAGWIDDALAFRKPWGFDLSAVSSPVKLWHGQDDTFSPVAHTYWLAKKLINAEVEIEIQEDAAHFDAMVVLPRMLAWLRQAEQRAASSGTTKPSERVRFDDPVGVPVLAERQHGRMRA